MTVAFKGDIIITTSGKEIIFSHFKKIDGITTGCYDIDNVFYPLSEIVY